MIYLKENNFVQKSYILAGMEAIKRKQEDLEDETVPRKTKMGERLGNDTQKIITICHVTEVEEIEPFLATGSGGFAPTYTHQMFNNKELVFGYSELAIKILLTPISLYPCVLVEYKAKDEDAENLSLYFSELWKAGYTTSLEKFKDKVNEESKCSINSADALYEFQTQGNEYYVINQKAVRFWNTSLNLQAILRLFIDGHSFIDKDPYWNLYILFKMKGEFISQLVGFATTYDFNQKIDCCRTRISQFLILPHSQRCGLGSQLLNGIYKALRANPCCFEITVEDPSDGFMSMRDIYDVLYLLKEKYFSKILHTTPVITSKSLRDFQLFESEKNEIQKILKLTPLQIERCFEIAVFARLDLNDEEAIKQFRLRVKRRLFMMNKDSLCPDIRLIMMQKTLRLPHIGFEGLLREGENAEDQEIEPDIIEVTTEQRKAMLHTMYTECEQWYLKLRPKIVSFFHQSKSFLNNC